MCQIGSAIHASPFVRKRKEVPMLRKALLAGAALLFLASPVMAQRLAIVRACAANISTLCKDVHPGKGRLAACVDSHFSELSGICQAAVTTVATTAKSCIADVKKLCAGVKHGGGRIEACMKSHLDEISEPCKSALSLEAAGKR
jgi:hypothetical protein